ncbi:beta-glucan synthesis-associated protein [Thecaphora frezii]
MAHRNQAARQSISLTPYRSGFGPINNATELQSLWGNLDPEEDDWLHNPDADDGEKKGSCSLAISKRGLSNVCTLILMTTCVLLVFLSYPFVLVTGKDGSMQAAGFEPGGANGTGQIAALPDSLRLIDPKTPEKAYTWKKPLLDRSSFHLVFSDEFETDGRTFWPGDDPFWEAVDIYYAATGDYEWYSPEAVNTSGGFLNIALEEKPTHKLNFRSGMLQSWNKFCFQGGYVEVSVILPGSRFTGGLWPGIWMMGNLGRPGYLGTTQGMW